jgi:hypothetical protein
MTEILTQVSSRILHNLQASSNFSYPTFRVSLLLFKIFRKCFTARTPKPLVAFHIYNCCERRTASLYAFNGKLCFAVWSEAAVDIGGLTARDVQAQERFNRTA